MADNDPARRTASAPPGGADHAGVIALTQELVRTPSVNDPEGGRNEAQAAEVVVATMRSFGWEPVVDEVAPGRPNVWTVVDGGLPGPTLLFEGHTDVVTEGDLDDWEVDPFGGEIDGGRLYGRGAADMKGGVAAMLYAAAAVQRRGPFPGRIKLAALVDEEGMMLGVKDFVARGHAEDVDAAIVCEPEGGEVCVAQKGALRVRIDGHGKMAHGAMPQHGRNPLPALAEVIAGTRLYQQELQRDVGPHALLGETYLTPTVLHGGDQLQINVIPSAAWLALDVRTVSGVDHDEVRDRLVTICREAGMQHDVRLEVSVLEDRPATETSIDHPAVRAVCRAHEYATGTQPVYGGVPGATDGTILHRDASLPVVVYGPGGKWIAHQANEYVEVAELTRCADVYASAAAAFFAAAEAGPYGQAAADNGEVRK